MKEGWIIIKKMWQAMIVLFHEKRNKKISASADIQETKCFTMKRSLKTDYKQEKRIGNDILYQVEDFLHKTYEFRFNRLTEMTEFKIRNKKESIFLTVGQRELNSICIAARRNGIDCWDRDISRYVNSGEISTYHPFRDYMDNLPVWDGTDRVEALAKRVSELPVWIKGFHLWIRGVVAQWMEWDMLHGNSVAPVLVSCEQGKHKSTFCKMLIPEQLQAYYTDSFDLNGKESEQKLTAFGLINLDELDKFTERKMALLKNMMQMAGINLRKAHKKSFISLPRIASFIATSNRKDLLTDPTGSRRFLCVEIMEKIDVTPIDHIQFYAQLKNEVITGKRYWFNSEEEKIIIKNNAGFQRRNMAEDVFWAFFRIPYCGEKGELLSAAEIFNKLKKERPAVMRDISGGAFGKTLISLGIERRHTRMGNLYHVVQDTAIIPREKFMIV